MWTDVKYEPGEIRVVAYNKEGKKIGEKCVRTAGKPHHLTMTASKTVLRNDGEDLTYITVSVVDKEGNLCPEATPMVQFEVKGAGLFRAAANGDATCLDAFHLPRHHAFAGQLTAIVQGKEQEGAIMVTAKAKGLKTATLQISATPQ